MVLGSIMVNFSYSMGVIEEMLRAHRFESKCERNFESNGIIIAIRMLWSYDKSHIFMMMSSCR